MRVKEGLLSSPSKISVHAAKNLPKILGSRAPGSTLTSMYYVVCGNSLTREVLVCSFLEYYGILLHTAV